MVSALTAADYVIQLQYILKNDILYGLKKILKTIVQNLFLNFINIQNKYIVIVKLGI